VQIMRELVSARASGRLVPFIGSGMSMNVCRDWTGFVKALEGLPGAVPVDESRPSRTDDREFVHRAARALERRRLGHGTLAAGSVRAALLEAGPGAPPDQTVALARWDWPLVLSTNYDDLYIAAVHERELNSELYQRKNMSDLERRSSPVQVVGRSSVDCHRVLCSLTHPAPPQLWALQGYLGGQATIRLPNLEPDRLDESVIYQEWAVPSGAADLEAHAVGAGLDQEIVVGHADYRRVTMRAEASGALSQKCSGSARCCSSDLAWPSPTC
jgi:hypothetical protein